MLFAWGILIVIAFVFTSQSNTYIWVANVFQTDWPVVLCFCFYPLFFILHWQHNYSTDRLIILETTAIYQPTTERPLSNQTVNPNDRPYVCHLYSLFRVYVEVMWYLFHWLSVMCQWKNIYYTIDDDLLTILYKYCFVFDVCCLL